MVKLKINLFAIGLFRLGVKYSSKKRNINNNKSILTRKIKEEALRLGFMACGISKAEKLSDHETNLSNYLQKGYHGKMQYMENHFEKRLNPALLVEGTKSVISLLYNYYTDKKQQDPNAPIISKYTYGKDYHFVIKDKLKQLLSFIQDKCNMADGRVFVDSAPVLERAWAQKSGLGWVGKNGNLLNKEFGSFFFIAELLIDIELGYNTAEAKNHCGQCTRCIDACPTKAIVEPGKVDGSKCISYLTIELKEEIPKEFKGKMDNRMFGCDVCQDVCPFNRKKAKNHTEEDFSPSKELMEMTKNDWHQLTNSQFNALFKNTAVKRTKYKGLMRNINFLKDEQ